MKFVNYCNLNNPFNGKYAIILILVCDLRIHNTKNTRCRRSSFLMNHTQLLPARRQVILIQHPEAYNYSF